MDAFDDIEKITPEEMEALAEVLQDATPAPPSMEDEDAVVLKYDLVGGSGSPRHSMPVLELVQDRFCQGIKQQLIRATRVEGFVEPVPPVHTTAAEIYSGLDTPCTVVSLNLPGLDSNGMLVVSPLLMMHLLDLSIGGTGADESSLHVLEIRGFSHTEKRLAGHLVKFIDRAFSSAWAGVAQVGLEYVRLESNPRHAVIINPKEPVVVLEAVLDWGSVKGEIKLVFPLAAIRPLESKLASTVVSVKTEDASPWRDTLFNHVEETPVEVIVEFGRAEMTLRQLLELGEGELIRLDREPGGPLDVIVEGTPKYVARPVIHHGNMAVEVLGFATNKEE